MARDVLFVRPMKSLAFALPVLVSLTSVAMAEAGDDFDSTASSPKGGYVALGGVAGSHLDARMGGALEVGLAMAKSMDLHMMIAGGHSGLFSNGAFMQVRLGAEARMCTARQYTCAFAGVDLGYDHEDVSAGEGLLSPSMDASSDGLVFVPRGGVEAGGGVKLRAALEALLYPATSDGSSAHGVQAIGSLVIVL